jgi:hypothetical protein
MCCVVCCCLRPPGDQLPRFLCFRSPGAHGHWDRPRLLREETKHLRQAATVVPTQGGYVHCRARLETSCNEEKLASILPAHALAWFRESEKGGIGKGGTMKPLSVHTRCEQHVWKMSSPPFAFPPCHSRNGRPIRFGCSRFPITGTSLQETRVAHVVGAGALGTEFPQIILIR